jgi:DNA-binding beta-propeller fold protein YncE
MPVLGAPGIALSAEPSAAAPTPSALGTRTLFWLDVSGKVMTSPADDFKAQTLVRSAGQGSDGIAVDVEHGYIYWTNMGVPADDDGTLVRANLDGSGLTTLIAAGGTFTPKQLKLEPQSGKLYWSDREGMRVMRSDLDGGQVETVYSAAEGNIARRDADNWCVGIAIDPAGGYFYWTQKGPDDAETGSIRRAPLVMAAGEDAAHRTDVEILYQGLAAPVDLDLDREHGFLYWANRGDDTINRAPIEVPAGKTGATRDDREVVVPDVPQAIGVAIDHERSLIYYTDAVGDVGRAALDGSGAEFLLEGRGAFTGIVVVNVP